MRLLKYSDIINDTDEQYTEENIHERISINKHTNDIDYYNRLTNTAMKLNKSTGDYTFINNRLSRTGKIPEMILNRYKAYGVVKFAIRNVINSCDDNLLKLQFYSDRLITVEKDNTIYIESGFNNKNLQFISNESTTELIAYYFNENSIYPLKNPIDIEGITRETDLADKIVENHFTEYCIQEIKQG